MLTFELKDMKNISKKFDYIAFFQPTSPIRKKSDILKCIKIIKKEKPDALWTISKIDTKFNPVKQLVIKKTTKILLK